MRKILIKNFWILAVILSLPAAWALTVSGFFGASDDMHIGWLYEMDKVVRMGQIPPRFVPDLSFGFGYPLFNFVFPLPFYIGELFHLIGLSLVDSIKAVFFVSLPLSSLFMYKFLKEFSNRWLSLAGAIIYTFTPYRSTDIYIRGAIGEALAFVFLPAIALSVVKLVSDKNKTLNFRWIGIGGLSLAALVLTHNITAYMFFPFILLLVLIQILFINSKRLSLLQLLLMVGLGLLSSIYFWLPAIIDSNLMVYDTVFNFSDHFPTIRQLLIPSFGYGASVPGPYDGMSFFIGTINLLSVVLGIFCLAFFWKKYSTNQKIILLWALASFVAAFLMMNYRSIFIWQNLPLLPYFQFPWRFLIITTFMTPILLVSFDKIKFSVFISLVVVAMAVLLNVGHFRPHDFLGRQDDYFLNRYIPIPVASQEYLGLQEEYLRLPKLSQKRPGKNYPRVLLEDARIESVEELNALDSLITTRTQQSFIVDYYKYNFEGWKAEIDGQPVPVFSGLPFGQINVEVPAGQHQVKITFKETNFKLFLDLISLGALFIALMCITKLYLIPGRKIKYN